MPRSLKDHYRGRFFGGKRKWGGRYFFRIFFLSSKFLWESVAAASFASIYPLGQRFFHFQNPFLVSRQEGGGGGLKFIGLRKKVLFFFSIFPFRGKREKRPSISKKKKVKVRKQKGAVFFVFDLRGKAKSAADAPKWGENRGKYGKWEQRKFSPRKKEFTSSFPCFFFVKADDAHLPFPPFP